MADSGTALAEQQLQAARFQGGEIPPESAMPIAEQLERARGQTGAETTTDVDAYLARRAEERSKKNARPAVEQAPAVDPNKPDPRPRREDFQDESAHTQAIAEWVVRQQNKIIAKPAEPAKAEEVQFNPNDRIHVELRDDFNRFQAAGRAFVESNPDFTSRLNEAAARGLTLDNKAQREIIRRAAPEVLHYLADPANGREARQIMAADTATQVWHVQRLASQLGTPIRQSGSDSRNNGGHGAVRRDQMDPDSYIQMRQREKREYRKARGTPLSVIAAIICSVIAGYFVLNLVVINQPWLRNKHGKLGG